MQKHFFFVRANALAKLLSVECYKTIKNTIKSVFGEFSGSYRNPKANPTMLSVLREQFENKLSKLCFRLQIFRNFH